jgi:hypothetical protein
VANDGGPVTVASEIQAANSSTGSFEVVAQEEMAREIPGVDGPWGSVWHGDLSGDGQDEAVFCVRQWGANDLFTTTIVFAFDGTSAASLLKETFANGGVALAGSQVVIASRVDWQAGQCVETTKKYFQWDGSRLALVDEETEQQFEEGAGR